MVHSGWTIQSIRENICLKKKKRSSSSIYQKNAGAETGFCIVYIERSEDVDYLLKGANAA